MSQHLFKVSTLCQHTSTKTASPLINCTVNDGLVHAVPNVPPIVTMEDKYFPDQLATVPERGIWSPTHLNSYQMV